jgi:hypothetical protein
VRCVEAVPGCGDKGWRLSARFLASMVWRRLGVVSGSCRSKGFLIEGLPLPAEKGVLAWVTAPLVLLGEWVKAPSPSCRLCRVANVGPDRVGEGDRGKEPVGGSEYSS